MFILGPIGIIIAMTCIIWAFIVSGGTGKTFLGCIFVVGAILSFILPGLSNSLWFFLVTIILGIGCFIYLLYNGYLAQMNWWWRRWR